MIYLSTKDSLIFSQLLCKIYAAYKFQLSIDFFIVFAKIDHSKIPYAKLDPIL